MYVPHPLADAVTCLAHVMPGILMVDCGECLLRDGADAGCCVRVRRSLCLIPLDRSSTKAVDLANEDQGTQQLLTNPTSSMRFGEVRLVPRAPHLVL